MNKQIVKHLYQIVITTIKMNHNNTLIFFINSMLYACIIITPSINNNYAFNNIHIKYKTNK